MFKMEDVEEVEVGWKRKRERSCCDRKVVIWEFSFFSYQKRQSGPFSTLQNHRVYILKLVIHTVQLNWICKLGRYIMM